MRVDLTPDEYRAIMALLATVGTNLSTFRQAASLYGEAGGEYDFCDTLNVLEERLNDMGIANDEAALAAAQEARSI